MTVGTIFLLILLLIPFMIKEHQQQKENQKNNHSYSNDNSLSLEDFNSCKDRLIRNEFDTEGVYIFTNIDKNNRKYVGQSINIIKRIDMHLKGRGNKDIYNDIAKGDKFTIYLIKLKDTEFTDLNALERYYISKYNSYNNGYNKTRGNKTVA